jgi:hypothetical protein
MDISGTQSARARNNEKPAFETSGRRPQPGVISPDVSICNAPEVRCAAERSRSPPWPELLGVIASHGPSRESYTPFRKSRGRPAEAFLRAFQPLRKLHGEDAGPWLLAIARNPSMTWLKRHRNAKTTPGVEEALEDRREGSTGPEEIRLLSSHREQVTQVLPYKGISAAIGIPLGTVCCGSHYLPAYLAVSPRSQRLCPGSVKGLIAAPRGLRRAHCAFGILWAARRRPGSG